MLKHKAVRSRSKSVLSVHLILFYRVQPTPVACRQSYAWSIAKCADTRGGTVPSLYERRTRPAFDYSVRM